jgi:two-component system LytT family response regulator
MSLRVLIADDEAPARRKLVRFLQAHSNVEIVAEAANGVDAIDLIAMTSPDLVFLDIAMPDLDGIGVAEEIARDGAGPHIIFVTAFNEFAVKAFEVRALDYLLKPYDRERFDAALARAQRTHQEKRVASGELASLVAELRKQGSYAKRLLVNDGKKPRLLAINDVVHLEADGNHVVVYAKTGTFRFRSTLESLAERLDPELFVRIHRSHLVRIESIAEIAPWFHGDYKLRLQDGTELSWSRRYAAMRTDLVP